MTTGDNFRNSDRIDSLLRNDSATKCSLEAWACAVPQTRHGNPRSAFNTNSVGALDLGANDPLLVAQSANTREHRATEESQFHQNASVDAFEETTTPEPARQHRYYQSLFIHPGDRAHGFRGKLNDPGHAAVQLEDEGTGFKTDIVGLSPDHDHFVNPIVSRGSIHRDTFDSTFEMQVRREISKDEFDKQRNYVRELIDRKNVLYSLMFPKQCTTEAIKMSSVGGWAIQVPKEKIAPFLPAQVTPNTLYDYFSKPQPLDLTNLDENGKPRQIEVYYLDPNSNNDRNYVAAPRTRE